MDNHALIWEAAKGFQQSDCIFTAFLANNKSMNDINFFHPGQVWQYNTRSGEEASTLTVLKIDELEDDAIIHIRIDGIQIGKGDHIGHLPFSAEAIEASVTGFVKHLDQLPGFEEGYFQWKQQFDAGKAGYWKITVKEAIEAIGSIL
jgi:hypothetical protein